MTGANLPDENEPVDAHRVSNIFGWWRRLKGNGTYPNLGSRPSWVMDGIEMRGTPQNIDTMPDFDGSILPQNGC